MTSNDGGFILIQRMFVHSLNRNLKLHSSRHLLKWASSVPVATFSAQKNLLLLPLRFRRIKNLLSQDKIHRKKTKNASKANT